MGGWEGASTSRPTGHNLRIEITQQNNVWGSNEKKRFGV